MEEPTNSDFSSEELDVIHSEPVKTLVSRWKRRAFDLDQEAQKPFSMLWLAGPEEKTDKIIDYIRNELGITRNSVINFDIDEATNMHIKLEKLADQIRTMAANRILIVANGFEKKLRGNEHYRIGHDWEQGILEDPDNSPWGKLYKDMNKHVTIITTIGLSSGPKNYQKAITAAVISQFSKGIIEVR